MNKIKMSRKEIFLLLMMLLSSCNGEKLKKEGADVGLIKIDWNSISDAMDYSSLVEDSVIMFPLETTDDCLIGEVTKLICQNNLIYIADNTSKSIFVFDMSGKLQTRVHAVGNGPGEYTNISYFAVDISFRIILKHILSEVN